MRFRRADASNRDVNSTRDMHCQGRMIFRIRFLKPSPPTLKTRFLCSRVPRLLRPPHGAPIQIVLFHMRCLPCDFGVYWTASSHPRPSRQLKGTSQRNPGCAGIGVDCARGVSGYYQALRPARGEAFHYCSLAPPLAVVPHTVRPRCSRETALGAFSKKYSSYLPGRG